MGKCWNFRAKWKGLFWSSYEDDYFTGGYLSVGQNVSITGDTKIISAKKITIGHECLISWDVQIMDTDFHGIFDFDGNILNESKEILIGNHVWIGCRSNVLKGVTIPDDSIIASNSLLTRKLIACNSIYGGSPIQEIKKNISWKR